MPINAGIYFLRDGEECVYVGQAVQFHSRATVTDEQAEPGFTVSWIERPRPNLSLDELFYIWLLRPRKNRAAVVAKKHRRFGEVRESFSSQSVLCRPLVSYGIFQAEQRKASLGSGGRQ